MMIEAGYDTLEKLRGASLAQIEAVPGVGSVKAQTLFNGLREKSALIDEILAEGVKINPPKVKSVGFLTGKSMCMTGFRDAKLQGDFEAAGGEIKSGVSKGLTYLVAKDANSGSSKLQKARELGVIVLSPAEMSALIAKGC
jgi:DNA ligase (NAD+)